MTAFICVMKHHIPPTVVWKLYGLLHNLNTRDELGKQPWEISRVVLFLLLDRLTNGVHEAAVHVGIEQIGHGQHGAVAQRCQAARHATLPPRHLLTLILHLAAVIQQVHEESEVPKDTREAKTGATIVHCIHCFIAVAIGQHRVADLFHINQPIN